MQNSTRRLGAVPLRTTPDQFADYFREESLRYAHHQGSRHLVS